MTTNISIDLIKKDLQDLGNNYKSVKEIYIFGSYSKGLQTEKSDIDIAVLCKDNSEYEPIIQTITNLTKQYKIFFHPVIYDKPKEELLENVYIKDNILTNTLLVYTK